MSPKEGSTPCACCRIRPPSTLPNPRLPAASPSVPVLVDERADVGLDARVAREFHGVLHVPKCPQDEDVLGPVGSGAVLDCGPASR